jgi:hypothetical protein
MALTVGVVLGAVVVGLVAGLFLTRLLAIPGSRPSVPAVVVVQEIQTLSELVTVRYVIEKVVAEEDVKWFGENRVLLVVHGVVKAGVDFQRLKPEAVEVFEGRVRIRLPPPQLVDAYLDESKTRVVERSTGLLRMFDKDLETVARQNAVMDIRRAAREAGILAEAEERARLQTEALLLRLGFKSVEVTVP